MKRMASEMRLIVSAFGLWLAAAHPLTAQLPGPGELIEKISLTGPGLSFRSRGRLTHTGASGDRKVYEVQIVQKRLARGVNLLWTVTDPPQERLRILVESPNGRTVVVWLARKNEPPIQLPESRWPEAILGTHLTIEDLASNYFAWPQQRVTGVEACGARTCLVLESRPGGRSAGRFYSSVTSWVDRDTYVPILVRKKSGDSGGVKEFQCLGTRRSGEHWVATGVEIRKAGSAGSTRLVFVRGTLSESVRDSEVDPGQVFGTPGVNP